jgi:hypothetical protein
MRDSKLPWPAIILELLTLLLLYLDGVGLLMVCLTGHSGPSAAGRMVVVQRSGRTRRPA